MNRWNPWFYSSEVPSFGPGADFGAGAGLAFGSAPFSLKALSMSRNTNFERGISPRRLSISLRSSSGKLTPIGLFNSAIVRRIITLSISKIVNETILTIGGRPPANNRNEPRALYQFRVDTVLDKMIRTVEAKVGLPHDKLCEILLAGGLDYYGLGRPGTLDYGPRLRQAISQP